VNPSLVETGAGPPGFLHLAGPQPEAACRLCHVAQGPEFGISVAGAHTIPARSQQLAGLEAEILSAVGAPGGSLQMEFRILDGGAPVSDIGGAGLNRIAIALSGPNTDFGAFDPPLIRPTVFGSGSSGVLSGPDPLGVFTYETDETLPEDAYGTWRVGLEARRSVELLDPFGAAAASATEAVQNPVLDFSVDGSPLAPRREVAGMDNCGECHGTFSKGFNIHGSLRNQSDYCVICHNPSMSDFARRNPAVTDENASVVNEPIGFKHMIHKIHTGEELESKPYIIYGFGFPFTPHEFSEVLFPGNRADCATCHVNDSHLLPLDEGLLPTLQTIVDAGTELVVGSIPVIQDACLACHGSMEAQAHADTYTSELGEESRTASRKRDPRAEVVRMLGTRSGSTWLRRCLDAGSPGAVRPPCRSSAGRLGSGVDGPASAPALRPESRAAAPERREVRCRAACCWGQPQPPGLGGPEARAPGAPRLRSLAESASAGGDPSRSRDRRSTTQRTRAARRARLGDGGFLASAWRVRGAVRSEAIRRPGGPGPGNP
jgi:hypothetical protein